MKAKKILFLLGFFCIAFNIAAQDVYVLNAHSKLEPVTRSVTLGNKVSGKAFLTLYGAKLTTSIVIDKKQAELALPMGATYFYVYTPKQIPIASWKLAVLKKGKKNTRELPYAKTSAYSGSQTAIQDIPLRIEKVSDRIYRLSPTETIAKGNYALFRLEAGVPAEVYDFRVDASLSPALEIPANDVVMAQFKVDNTTKELEKQNEVESDLMLGSKALLSDVDTDIPVTKQVAENTFALIISNENYKHVEKVPFALNDGKVFEQYLKLAIGVPEKHITSIKDASLSDIKYAMNKIMEISEAYEGDAKIIVHYSGHGIPDVSSHEGYILPVDGYATDPTTALKLTDLYSQLGKMKAKSLILFIDACFSGTQRTGDMLASARGVAIKVKDESPVGNLVVLSAAQGDQTAYPYTSKEHGLMTYYLLKKIKETNGDVKLGELFDYITTNVKRTSLVENGKSQIPILTCDESNTNWRKQTLR